MAKWLKVLALVAVFSLVVGACGTSSSASPSAASAAPTTGASASPAASSGPVAELPRNETLYTSGTQYGPPNNWNPINAGGYATGTLGLLYEPLFHYSPLETDATKAYTPWLADPSSGWTGDKEYTIKLRAGIKWTDGQPLNADDVIFTLDLGKLNTVPYAVIWNFLDKTEKVDDTTVKVTFKEAAFQQWANFLYNQAIVPKHLWTGKMDAADTVLGVNENPIGSGPYKFSRVDQDRMVWEKNADWWGKAALNLDPKPKYIVDLVNGGNNVMLGLVLQGSIDLSNNFLPGVATIVSGGYGLQTYYKDPPFMMSANTAWLVPNTTKKPLDDPKFRKALADSIDTSKIVNNVYGQLVLPASPTGLLPVWDTFVDKDLVASTGFKFDLGKAKSELAAAGYKDTDGDNMVNNKDGSKFELSLIVPTGWTDWEESIRSIATSAQAAGINVKADTTNDYNARTDKIQKGTFDLAIMNDQQMSNTPWTYYNWMFYLAPGDKPILDTQNTSSGNLQRFKSDEAWALVQQLDHTQATDVAGMKSVISKLQKIQLEQLPIIPLWYNGLWSQANNSVWTNWPSQEGYHVPPTTWRGYWQMGGVEMLDKIQLKPAS